VELLAGLSALADVCFLKNTEETGFRSIVSKWLEMFLIKKALRVNESGQISDFVC